MVKPVPRDIPVTLPNEPRPTSVLLETAISVAFDSALVLFTFTELGCICASFELPTTLDDIVVTVVVPITLDPVTSPVREIVPVGTVAITDIAQSPAAKSVVHV